MPALEKAAPNADTVIAALEKGARARQLVALGVTEDLTRHREQILRLAEMELRASKLTPDRAFMHLACCNALRTYREEIEGDIVRAQRAADQVHAETEKPADADV
jgi:hypothetical protein